MVGARAKRIRVVFLVMYFEAWDSLAETWALMSQDDRFEVTVISIPRRLTGDIGYHDEARVSEFLTSAGVQHLRFDFEDSQVGLNRLRELAPDFLFINYPWQRNYQPFYRVDHLVQFTRVCYVPYYSLPLVLEPGDADVASHLFTQRSHQLASHIFVQDAVLHAAYGNTERGNEHVHFVGSPKLDSLLAGAQRADADSWPISRNVNNQTAVGAVSGSEGQHLAGIKPGDRNLRLVWAPHHSYGPNWLNFGTFASVCQEFLAFAQANPQIDIVMRPHPFLFGTLVDRGVMNQTDLDVWLAAWAALANTFIDHAGDFAELFRATDYLVSDGISFLAEYPLVAGKPGFFIEKPDHWPFTSIGELAAEANIRVGSFAEFAAALPRVAGVSLNRESQLQALRSAAMPYPGESAAKIVEIIAKDAAESALIEPSTLQQPSWESIEGREPAKD